MAENRTQPTGESVEAFIDSVDHEGRREDARRLDTIFRETTGFVPQMWGPSIIGYGRYHYRYDSGREGDFLATGFSPRKANMVLYILPGYAEFGPILDRLGKHRAGASCLYLGRLSGVDEGALRELIMAGLADLRRQYKVEPR